MGASTLPFLLNVVLTHVKGKKVEVDDPLGLRRFSRVGDFLPTAAS